jgi:hypothetical protein
MDEDVANPTNLTPRVRRAARLQLRYYKGMYVMHMERFYELREQFWDAMRRGDAKAAQWALQDAQAMAGEAQALLRKQHITERRLLLLRGTEDEPDDDGPLPHRARMRARLTLLESPLPESSMMGDADDETPR